MKLNKEYQKWLFIVLGIVSVIYIIKPLFNKKKVIENFSNKEKAKNDMLYEIGMGLSNAMNEKEESITRLYDLLKANKGPTNLQPLSAKAERTDFDHLVQPYQHHTGEDAVGVNSDELLIDRNDYSPEENAALTYMYKFLDDIAFHSYMKITNVVHEELDTNIFNIGGEYITFMHPDGADENWKRSNYRGMSIQDKNSQYATNLNKYISERNKWVNAHALPANTAYRFYEDLKVDLNDLSSNLLSSSRFSEDSISENVLFNNRILNYFKNIKGTEEAYKKNFEDKQYIIDIIDAKKPNLSVEGTIGYGTSLVQPKVVIKGAKQLWSYYIILMSINQTIIVMDKLRDYYDTNFSTKKEDETEKDQFITGMNLCIDKVNEAKSEVTRILRDISKLSGESLNNAWLAVGTNIMNAYFGIGAFFTSYIIIIYNDYIVRDKKLNFAYPQRIVHNLPSWPMPPDLYYEVLKLRRLWLPEHILYDINKLLHAVKWSYDQELIKDIKLFVKNISKNLNVNVDDTTDYDVLFPDTYTKYNDWHENITDSITHYWSEIQLYSFVGNQSYINRTMGERKWYDNPTPNAPPLAPNVRHAFISAAGLILKHVINSRTKRTKHLDTEIIIDIQNLQIYHVNYFYPKLQEGKNIIFWVVLSNLVNYRIPFTYIIILEETSSNKIIYTQIKTGYIAANTTKFVELKWLGENVKIGTYTVHAYALQKQRTIKEFNTQFDNLVKLKITKDIEVVQRDPQTDSDSPCVCLNQTSPCDCMEGYVNMGDYSRLNRL
jgi:hypothetical protein